jgi:TonB family protein
MNYNSRVLFRAATITLALGLSAFVYGQNSPTSGHSEKVYTPGGSVMAPRAVKAPNPQYSKEAVKQNIQGIVVLSVVVGPDGTPEDIRVARSLGHGLDEEAIKAMRKWHFQPATKDGKPVAAQISVEIHFKRRW